MCLMMLTRDLPDLLSNRFGRTTAHRPAELDDLCAPRGALLYSPRSGHGLEEVSLDLMADPLAER